MKPCGTTYLPSDLLGIRAWSIVDPSSDLWFGNPEPRIGLAQLWISKNRLRRLDPRFRNSESRIRQRIPHGSVWVADPSLDPWGGGEVHATPIQSL